MHDSIDRRTFFRTTTKLGAGAALASTLLSKPTARAQGGGPAAGGANRGIIFKAVKLGMVQIDGSLADKFQLLKDVGFDGVELDSPGGVDKQEARAASQSVGLPIHGVVDGIHWNIRLSDPDPAIRVKGQVGLRVAISDAHCVGGSAVLLVPGKVTDPVRENQQQVWQRSIEQIRLAIPWAARHGVRILIENVWNGFCYRHDGPADQTADQLAAYLDEIGSPWVGSYFDIGNHQKYGQPAQWIRTLGRRIVKLDVKGFARPDRFCDIGDGDIDWPDVRRALREIGFTGWATAEVGGGDRKRLEQIARQMDRVLDL
ncbi:MAG: xylose isomerase [Planctomycetes bacterium RBG_16_64_10]|nr:MAG: xylose isomerase [Planctomycetes bacterium RBG_16_64_10]